jgi:general L-amino acid transport system substrate-binding protein
VTSGNVGELSAAAGGNPEINRMLGTEGSLGEMLGLSADWAKNAIMAGGNYGELFEGNIGENTPLAISRGLNAQWTNGGLIYSPPFR